MVLNPFIERLSTDELYPSLSDKSVQYQRRIPEEFSW